MLFEFKVLKSIPTESEMRKTKWENYKDVKTSAKTTGGHYKHQESKSRSLYILFFLVLYQKYL